LLISRLSNRKSVFIGGRFKGFGGSNEGVSSRREKSMGHGAVSF